MKKLINISYRLHLYTYRYMGKFYKNKILFIIYKKVRKIIKKVFTKLKNIYKIKNKIIGIYLISGLSKMIKYLF